MKRLLTTFIFSLPLMFMVAATTAQQTTGQEDSFEKVYRLQNVVASEIAKKLESLVPGVALNDLYPEDKRNWLIVSTDKLGHAKLNSELTRLGVLRNSIDSNRDSIPDSKSRPGPLVYRPQHVAPADAVRMVGQLVQPDSGVRVALDQRSGSIVISADHPEQLDEITNLFRQVDIPSNSKEAEVQSLELTVMLIIEGADEIMKASLPSPPEPVKELIAEMTENPYLPVLQNPLVGGIIMNRVVISDSRNGESLFQPGPISSMSRSKDGLCELSLLGRVQKLDSKQFLLEAEFKIVLKFLKFIRGDGQAETAEIPKRLESFSSTLNTQVAVTKGHPVILGLTSIEGVDCLVIVLIE